MRSAASEHLSTPPPEDWREFALCSQMVADAYPEDRRWIANYWYPPCGDGQETLNHPEAAKAAAICGECPVKGPCLERALALDLKHGIFAGTVPSQRKRMAAVKQRQEVGV